MRPYIKISQSDNSAGGAGLLTVLGLVFIVLKLTGYIDWSWWWVLAPIWVPYSIVLLVVLLVMVGAYAKTRK